MATLEEVWYHLQVLVEVEGWVVRGGESCELVDRKEVAICGKLRYAGLDKSTCR